MTYQRNDTPEPIPTACVPRYVLHPGPVQSQFDGQWHNIDARALCRLYGLRWDEVWVDYGPVCGVNPYQPRPGDIHLYPRRDGDYRLPGHGTQVV